MTNPNPLKFEIMLSETDERHVGMVRGEPVSYDPNPDENRTESRVCAVASKRRFRKPMSRSSTANTGSPKTIV